MAIRPKLNKQIDEIIEKGGDVATDKIKTEWVHIDLRIPKKMVEEIEKVRKTRIGTSRNAWILQALQDKLES